MNTETNHAPKDLAYQMMALEIVSELLTSTNLSDLGQRLTEQLRELTGALTIMLIEHHNHPEHDSLIYTCPPRRANLFSADEIDSFCPFRTPEELPSRVDQLPPEHPLYKPLQREEITSILRFPLSVGGELLGTLLLLNLSDLSRINESKEIITIFSQIIALSLKNAISHNRLEQQAKELAFLTDNLELQVGLRTRELQIVNEELFQKNETLKNSRRATLNLIQDTIQAKNQLEKLTIELENEIGERKQTEIQLRAAKEKAEAASVAKSVFLANMSHEIRTPLNAILGFSGLLKNQDGMSAENQKKLSIINQSGEHLLRMINDILNMAKIDAGRLRFVKTAFKLEPLIREVTDMLQHWTTEKQLYMNVNYATDLPEMIETDALKLKQILINLLNNAVKFTNQGIISLRIDSLPQTSRNSIVLLIEVKDTGIGISAADQERIFDPFMQVDDLNFQKGTGLGLSICKKYIELLDGRISVESEIGKGACFRIELPVSVKYGRESIENNQNTQKNEQFKTEQTISDIEISKINDLQSTKILNILSKETISRLNDALIRLDTKRIHNLITEITQYNPEAGKFLTTLADQFKFSTILESLNEIPNS